MDQIGRALMHRGPDGVDVWKEGPVALGHLMMRITPESLEEKCPCISKDGNLIITADARIDNREDLFGKLSIPALEQKKIPDSQLILRAFEKWGPSCPAHLLGEFAFAVWDKRSRTLFCVRDHMGFRPFFFHISAHCFIFSSESRAIRRLPFVSTQLDESALFRALLPVLQQDEAGDTFFKGIRYLKMGRLLTLRITGDMDQPLIQQYWKPEDINTLRFSSDGQYAEALRELVKASVHCRLRSLPHLPVAVSLSGGLDSSAVACIAAQKLREQNRSLIAVSSVLEENYQGIESDERPYIRAVADQEQNIQIHYVTAKGTGLFEGLNHFFDQTDTPVNYYNYMDNALRCTAKNLGASLLLNGTGGDHMASYEGWNALYRLFLDMRLIDLGQLLRLISKAMHIPLRDLMIKRIASPILSPWRRSNGHPLDISPINPEFVKRCPSGLTIDQNRGTRVTRDYRATIIQKATNGNFAAGLENIRYAHLGMEGLFPMFDRRLLDFFLSIPLEKFLLGGWSRGLFRHAMAGILPPLIQWRKDKHPYCPDFHRRVLSASEEIRQFLLMFEPNDPLLKYIDINKLQEQLKQVKPLKGRAQWEGKTASIVVKGMILLHYLKWHKNESFFS